MSQYKADLLKGKVILITGGGSGLGLAMAHGICAHGGDVAICGRTEDKLNKAVEELAAHGTRVFRYVCDVRDYEAVGKMLAQVEADFGRIDGLINNAAGNFLCAAEDLTPGGFRAVVDIVLHGAFNCAQQVGKRWIDKAQNGVILNIITTYTETGSSFVLPSAAAKAGVLAMANTMAYEWGGYGIRVNCVSPGPFPTEGAWSRLMPAAGAEEMMIAGNPMKRPGRHEELADMILFLLSDLSSYVTGANFVIDGGERLQGAQFNFISRMMPREQLKQAFRAMRGKEK
jgi:NAD(P)-dependent dehydrogenase (short-subunit alcohol dehydrogenase family)